MEGDVVAGVYVDDAVAGSWVSVSSFSRGSVWSAEFDRRRLVSLQQ
jgi:hypothetical protein